MQGCCWSLKNWCASVNCACGYVCVVYISHSCVLCCCCCCFFSYLRRVLIIPYICMRTRRRFSTNRINYIRQRHHNKLYDYAKLRSTVRTLFRLYFCQFRFSTVVVVVCFFFFYFFFYSFHFVLCMLGMAFFFFFFIVLFNFVFVILFGVVRLFADGSSANNDEGRTTAAVQNQSLTNIHNCQLNGTILFWRKSVKRKYMFT